MTEGDEGSSLLEPLPDSPSRWLTVREKITVKTARLDEFLKENLKAGENVRLLKTDAQGSDLDVLLSAGDYLKPGRIESVHAEINFNDFYHGQNRYHEVFAFLDRAGYRLARLYPTTAHDGWVWMGDALFVAKHPQ